MSAIIGVVILLGILILAHEWGHFLAARLFGVRVDIFSIGFGPRLWGRKRGPTDYRLSLLPLGGYVKMAGDNPLEERTGAADEFLSKPRWQRAIIALAGPTMNIVLAIILITGLFLFMGVPYASYFDEPVRIVSVGQNTPAAKAGMQPGDLVVEINGVNTPTWRKAREIVEQGPSELSVVVQRQGKEVTVVAPTNGSRFAERLLGYPNFPPVLEELASGGPAARAGLKPGDVILEVDGQEVATWPEFVQTILSSGGKALKITAARNGQPMSFEVVPERRLNPENPDAYQIGVAPYLATSFERIGVGESLQYGLDRSVGMTKQILGVVGNLFQGKASIKQLGGPIEIARQSGRAVKAGTAYFLTLMAVISMNLAILNLLPIPILDGGHILMLGIEGALRRDMSIQFKERFVQVGLVFLLVIFAVVMYNDVLKTWGK